MQTTENDLSQQELDKLCHFAIETLQRMSKRAGSDAKLMLLINLITCIAIRIMHDEEDHALALRQVALANKQTMPVVRELLKIEPVFEEI